MKTLSLNNIAKRYRKQIVLDNCSYTFKCGYTYMLLGENGSGKSTILKLILKLIYPTSGKIINEFESISYVPEKIILPQNIKVVDFLNVLNEIKKGNGYLEYLKIFEIEFALNYLLKQLSKGMLQKVLIIQALLKNSEVYIFDEVLNGLDINMQQKLLNLIKELKKEGKTIIITSHYAKYYSDVVDCELLIKGKKIIENN